MLTWVEQMAVEASASTGLTRAELPALVDFAKQVAARAPGEEAEQLRVQLAGVGVAALGGTSDPVVAKEGDYGWSVPYGDVLALRRKYDALQTAIGELSGLIRVWPSLTTRGRREDPGQPGDEPHVKVGNGRLDNHDPFVLKLMETLQLSGRAAMDLPLVTTPPVIRPVKPTE